MFTIEVRRHARKSLDKIPPPERTRLLTALLKLEQVPRPKGTEKIRGTELWRVREGDYRIVYFIDDEKRIVTIVRIGHRKDIYREF